MNLSDEMTMKSFAESLQIDLNESMDKLQGERKVKALRLLTYLEWTADAIEELKVKNVHLHQEIQNLKELLD